MRRVQKGILTGVLLLLMLMAVGCGRTEKMADDSKAKKVSSKLAEPEEVVRVDCVRPLRVGQVVYHVDDLGNLYAREGEKETLLVEGRCEISTYKMAGGYVFYEYEREQAGKTEEVVCCANLQDIENTASFMVELSQEDDYDYAMIMEIDIKCERIYVKHQNTVLTLDFSCQEIRSDTFEGEVVGLLPSDDEIYVTTKIALYQLKQDRGYKKQAVLSEDLSRMKKMLFRYGDYLYGELDAPGRWTNYTYLQISIKTGKVTYFLGDFDTQNVHCDEERHLIYFDVCNGDEKTVAMQFAEDGTYQKQSYPVPALAVRDGKIYYADKASLMCYDMDSGNKTVFQTIDKKGYYIGGTSNYNTNYIRIIGDTMYYVVLDCRHKLEDKYGAYRAERQLVYAYSFQDKQTSLLTENSVCWDELAVGLFAEQRDTWMAVLEKQGVTDIQFCITDFNDNGLLEIYAEGLAKDGEVLERVLYEYHVSDAGWELIPQKKMHWPDGDLALTNKEDYFVSDKIKLSSEEAKKLSDKKLKEILLNVI